LDEKFSKKVTIRGDYALLTRLSFFASL